ncbi:unnamed protein product [Sphenostylis stenocarpa]|uniref:Pentatricopeptide repeat-containing protein n=1 Tax=Sphenostylis stenocarpa TaxID=92480 RepID=A0AA86S1B0_9FABA|nr:unnamed protein product [Sphenostylis stenocarpa]
MRQEARRAPTTFLYRRFLSSTIGSKSTYEVQTTPRLRLWFRIRPKLLLLKVDLKQLSNFAFFVKRGKDPLLHALPPPETLLLSSHRSLNWWTPPLSLPTRLRQPPLPPKLALPSPSSNSLAPVGLYNRASSDPLDPHVLFDLFDDCMASHRWTEVKCLFETWVRALDKNGKPNSPDVNLFNHYLRANLILGAYATDLLDLVAQMDEFRVQHNTASFNLVLKAMCQANETVAADKLLQRMLQTGNDALPDDQSYDFSHWNALFHRPE